MTAVISKAALVASFILALASCAPAPPEPPASMYSAVTVQVTVKSASESVAGARVTPDFFTAARTSPLVGRAFAAADYSPGAAAVAVLHYDLWQRLFGGALDVVGSTVQIDGRPATVIGIMPRGFGFPQGAQIWTPRPVG